MRASINDEGLFVRLLGSKTKWAFVVRRLLTVLNVNHSVRRPKVLERVWYSGQFARKFHARFGHYLNLRFVFDCLENSCNCLSDRDSVFLVTISESEAHSSGLLVLASG